MGRWFYLIFNFISFHFISLDKEHWNFALRVLGLFSECFQPEGTIWDCDNYPAVTCCICAVYFSVGAYLLDIQYAFTEYELL